MLGHPETRQTLRVARAMSVAGRVEPGEDDREQWVDAGAEHPITLLSVPVPAAADPSVVTMSGSDDVQFVATRESEYHCVSRLPAGGRW